MVIHEAINGILGYFLPTDFTYFEKLTIFLLAFGVVVFILKKVGVIS